MVVDAHYSPLPQRGPPCRHLHHACLAGAAPNSALGASRHAMVPRGLHQCQPPWWAMAKGGAWDLGIPMWGLGMLLWHSNKELSFTSGESHQHLLEKSTGQK